MPVPQGPSGPNARSTRKRPADFTGKQMEKLSAEAEVEKAEAAQQMAMATAEKMASKDEVVNYTGQIRKIEEVEKADEVEVNEPYVTIRVNSDIDQMTFGREVVSAEYVDDSGNYHPAVMGSLRMYDFEAGVKYEVPREMAVHLMEKGYVYDY